MCLTRIPPRGIIVFVKEEIRKKAIRRLKILEGQVRGVQKMVKDEEYCVDILCQTTAVKKALSSIEDLILENHLSTHIIEQIKSGNIVQPVKEVLTIYKLAKRK